MKVSVSGLREIEKQMENLSRAASKGAARRAAVQAMQPMADLAKSLAPDDPVTGAPDLHRSIAVSSSSKPGRSIKRLFEGPMQVNVFMGPTREGYPQAMFQEFGTIKHAAQPYMRPAWDQDKMAMLDRLKEALADQVTKAVARADRRAARAAAQG